MHAPGEDCHPALALVNTARNSPDGPVDDLGAWIEAQGVGAGSAALAAARGLRDAVRELLHARIDARLPAPDAVAAVNAASAAVPTAPALVWDASHGPSRRQDSVAAPALARALAGVAADAIDLVTGAEQTDLHACGAPGCIRLLVRDHPRRQWCSTRCGDRVRAARYYRRHKAGGP
jgi:predicted RNA-binding Zn ribbon-like protein